jgi:hypothetical protein
MTETSKPGGTKSGDDDAPDVDCNVGMPVSEAELARVISAGKTVDLGGAQIDAEVLRRLITGQNSDCMVTPFGVRLRNAEIIGRLDLEGLDVPFPLTFARIIMQASGQNSAIVARDARLRRFSISNSKIAGSIVADRAQFEKGVIIVGRRIGSLLVRGATIGGALSIEGSQFGDDSVAILAAGARISGPLVLRGARAHGEVQLQRSHLEAGLRADDLKVMDEGAGMYCDAARVGDDVQLNNAQIAGPFRFENTTINGGLTAQNLTVDAPTLGMHAAGIEITQSLELSNSSIIGPLNLEGASIGKRLLAEKIAIDGGETAIAADIIWVGGNWEMPHARLVGQLRCPGACIEGQLRCTSARIFGSDIAIRADGARIAGGVFFFRAVISGGVRFLAAQIDNQFRFSGATLKVSEGAALIASGAILCRDAELNAGFQTIGGVILDQTEIHGSCDLSESHIKSSAVIRSANGGSVGGTAPITGEAVRPNLDDLAVSLVDAHIDRLEIPARTDQRPRGIVDLSRARVGAYVDWAATWLEQVGSPRRQRGNDAPDHLILDGFTYEHLENPAGVSVSHDGARAERERAGQRRISWLLGQAAADTKGRFKPQAWVYLSRQLMAQGLDRDARKITIERRRRERGSHWSTSSARWESRFLDWFALYGFNPWRTVAWMAAVIILFAGIWAWSASNCAKPGCFDETVFVTARRDAFSTERFTARYPAFHPLAYSFDVFVPFVSFGYEDHWRPNMSYGPIATWRLPHLPAFVGGETEKELIFADVTITMGHFLCAGDLGENSPPRCSEWVVRS